MAGTWGTLGGASGLPNGPANAGTMLLLTDGTVLCHDEPNTGAVSGSNRWYKLSPDFNGSYENGQLDAVAGWAELAAVLCLWGT